MPGRPRRHCISKLKCEGGVQILLDHMWAELEPLAFVRVFKTLHEFYERFQHSRSQDFVSYDTAFRTQLLDEIGAGIEGLTKGYWYLAKASISDDLRQKVVSATEPWRGLYASPMEGAASRSPSSHGGGGQLRWRGWGLLRHL